MANGAPSIEKVIKTQGPDQKESRSKDVMNNRRLIKIREKPITTHTDLVFLFI
jgi:hypothetical protein